MQAQSSVNCPETFSDSHSDLVAAEGRAVDASVNRPDLSAMSRAFINEDAQGEEEPRFVLPDPDDPGFPEAAAWALLEGADMGFSLAAERATGYRWGEPSLVPHVEAILAQAEELGEERLQQLARRFLRTAGRTS